MLWFPNTSRKFYQRPVLYIVALFVVTPFAIFAIAKATQLHEAASSRNPAHYPTVPLPPASNTAAVKAVTDKTAEPTSQPTSPPAPTYPSGGTPQNITASGPNTSGAFTPTPSPQNPASTPPQPSNPAPEPSPEPEPTPPAPEPEPTPPAGT